MIEGWSNLSNEDIVQFETKFLYLFLLFNQIFSKMCYDPFLLLRILLRKAILFEENKSTNISLIILILYIYIFKILTENEESEEI